MFTRGVERNPWALSIVPLLILASWIYLLAGSGMDILAMSTLQFPPMMAQSVTPSAWSVAMVAQMSAMWWIMMLAMMLPGITGTIRRCFSMGGSRFATYAVLEFCCGYASVWMLFAIAATAIQWVLVQLALLHPMMMWSLSTELSAIVLLGVGAYQFTSIKAAVLLKCRVDNGLRLSVTAGLKRGIRCLVNSAALMSLLFVGGVMNIYWIAGLTLINWLENELPNPRKLSLLVGTLCLVAVAHACL